MSIRHTINEICLTIAIAGVIVTVAAGVGIGIVDKISKQSSPVIGKPFITCDKKLHDKVFETCRRNIVDKMYEYYTENKPAVKFYCGMLAQETTCK